MPFLTSPLHALSSAAGTGLAAAARVVGKARSAPKPLHPRGVVVPAVLRRDGSQERTGVPLLDSPGTDEVRVRLSRAAGLPDRLPDVHGLALRLRYDGGDADLLLASTGLGRVSRFVLTFAREPEGRPMTTLLPYRSPTGPLLVAARPAGAGSFEMLWARPAGNWHAFGRLELGQPDPSAGPDPLVSFDPVRNLVPGLESYGWVRRLREPAYAAARDESGRAQVPGRSG